MCVWFEKALLRRYVALETNQLGKEGVQNDAQRMLRLAKVVVSASVFTKKNSCRDNIIFAFFQSCIQLKRTHDLLASMYNEFVKRR